MATAKFLLFDVGVANTLKRTPVIEPASDPYGRALEHLVFLELRSFLDYRRLIASLLTGAADRSSKRTSRWGHVRVEVKSKTRVSPRDYKGLNALSEEVRLKRKIVICGERTRRKADDGVEIMPPEQFLKELWTGNILD